MAFTTPRTWVSGETVTAALLNVHLRDNLLAIGGAWSTYTPALTASSSNPTLGTASSATGEYIAAGKLIIGRAKIVFGSSGVAAGSGTYRISLPTPAAAVKGQLYPAYLFDSSVPAACTPIAYVAATTYLSLLYPATWPTGTATNVTNSTPWTWAANDTIEVSFCYEAA